MCGAICSEETVAKKYSLPVNEVADHDEDLDDHHNGKDGSGEAWLASRARRGLGGKTLGRHTDIPLDHVQSFLDFIQGVLKVIVANGLSRADTLRLFALVLYNRGGSLMNFGHVSPIINRNSLSLSLLTS